MRKHTPKTNLDVSGRMNHKDAGFTGKVLAIAVLVTSLAPVIWAFSEVIRAIRWW